MDSPYDKLKARSKDLVKPKPTGPVWKGPHEDGVTFSLLCRFLVCRERFRLLAVEGLRPIEGFNYKIEYGQMWHTCEEAYGKTGACGQALLEYLRELSKRYRTQQEAILHWGQVCSDQFQAYLAYWETAPFPYKAVRREEVFCVPYTLPSHRVVLLRGKRDGVLEREDGTCLLFEHKTKSEINETQLKRQLTFDLQTMLYLTALTHEGGPGSDVRGVLYNVIRRPLSGGKGSIRQHQPTKANPQGESKEAFYRRLATYYEEFPAEFFARWEVAVRPSEIKFFRERCLDPILEQLCDWWEWVSGCASHGVNVWDNDVSYNGEPWGDGNPHTSAVHWIHPYGVWNPLNEGASTDLDECLRTGTTAGLERVPDLFPELK